jgi:hypothetical protein
VRNAILTALTRMGTLSRPFMTIRGTILLLVIAGRFSRAAGAEQGALVPLDEAVCLTRVGAERVLKV